MASRTALVAGFALLLLAGSYGIARSRAEPSAKPNPKTWVSGVLTRISEADGRAGRANGPGGTVSVRVRIGSDGSLDGAAIDESSGKAELDERALRAVRAAAPFAPPPAKLLTLEGFTELSFPLQLGNP